MKTLKDCKKAKELMELDFPPNLLVDEEYCEKIFQHCKEHNMKFLKDSYGTIIHKKFHKHFKTTDNTLEHLTENTIIDTFFDHCNQLQSQHEKDIMMITSSPYITLRENRLEQLLKYPYSVYVINPNFLDYIEFARQSQGLVRTPLINMNYAFTDASNVDMMVINDIIYEDTGLFPSFIPFKIDETYFKRERQEI